MGRIVQGWKNFNHGGPENTEVGVENYHAVWKDGTLDGG